MAGRKRAAIIRAATGDAVVVGEAELQHAMRHSPLPRDLVLSLIARVLEHPTVVLVDDASAPHEYRLFYRLDDGRYLLAIVKLNGHRCVLRQSLPDRPPAATFASQVPEGAAMKTPIVSFRHFATSGPLSIYWHGGPYGDAIEATTGRGVAWLAPNGDLLGVEFDDVRWDTDDQTLELPNGDVVTVRVRSGNVTTRAKRRGRHRAA